MNDRHTFLSELGQYIENVENEITLLLQNIQWDEKRVMLKTAMTACKYDSNHRIPANTKEEHEKQCYLTHEGYNKNDILLPDPVDPHANTVVRLSKQDTIKIINKASSSNPTFKRGSKGAEPFTLERLQQVYTADERRAIYDEVVSSAPSCHDLSDLALPSTSSEGRGRKEKSRAEILAELRDMKRRRTKYRVAAKTSNYSDALRDVIKTQMESYAEAKGIFIKTEYGRKSYTTLKESSETCSVTPPVIKQERMSPESDKTSTGYRESDTYDGQKKRHSGDTHRQYYQKRHKSSSARKYYDKDDTSHSDRPKYDNGQAKYSKHRTREDRKYTQDRHYEASEKYTSKGSRRYESDYKSKNEDHPETTKYDRHCSKEDQQIQRYSKHIRDGNHSRSHQYRDREQDSSYSRKIRESRVFDKDTGEKSNKKRKYETNK